MSAAWFILSVLVWTGGLASLAHRLTAGHPGAKFAQIVWRGCAGLSVLPWIVIAGLAMLPTAIPAALPDIPYVEPVSDAVAGASAGLRSAVTGSVWSWTGPVLLAVLVSGWGLRAGASVLGQVRLQRLKAGSAAHAPEPAVLPAQQLKLEKMPEIRLIDEGSPFVAGLARRVIYVPRGLETPGDLRQIAVHECVHVLRGDLITRPLERLVADLFWFSPFAWMMRRELDFWREAVCDEVAASISGDRIAYSRTLARAARLSVQRGPIPVASFILPRKRSLNMRLNRLLENRRPRSRPIAAATAALAALIGVPFAVGQTGVASTGMSYSHPVIIDEGVAVSSHFGKRKDPFDKQSATHHGTDIKGPTGTAIYTPAEGKVGFSGFKKNYGEMIEVIYADGSKLIYCQLSERLVEKGDRVQPGEEIGRMGESGRATGPHLHIEYWRPVTNEAGETEMQTFDPQAVEGLVLFEN